MSCFGGVATTRGGSCRTSRPWRWWRAKCAGIAASVGSRLRRTIKGLDGRRRRRATWTSVVRHRRQYSTSFAPVYVDELYNDYHDQLPGSKRPLRLNAVAVREEPSTSGKLVVDATGASRPTGKAAACVAAATTTTTTNTAAGARAGGKPRAAAAGVGAMKNILMRSPGRGEGVVCAVKGMGEVDLRAELFIRKFKEDMRLQRQRSAEEFQAMLARGL